MGAVIDNVRFDQGRVITQYRYGRVDLHESPRLFIARTPCPEHPEGCYALVENLLLLDGVVVEVQVLAFVPQVSVNLLSAEVCTIEPLLACHDP